jgi:hypothetical protein
VLGQGVEGSPTPRCQTGPLTTWSTGSGWPASWWIRDVGAPNRTSNGNPFTVFDVMSYCKDGNDANSAWTSAPGWTRDTYLLQLGYPPVRRRAAPDRRAGARPARRGADDHRRRAQITVVPPSTTSSMPLT